MYVSPSNVGGFFSHGTAMDVNGTARTPMHPPAGSAMMPSSVSNTSHDQLRLHTTTVHQSMHKKLDLQDCGCMFGQNTCNRLLPGDIVCALQDDMGCPDKYQSYGPNGKREIAGAGHSRKTYDRGCLVSLPRLNHLLLEAAAEFAKEGAKKPPSDGDAVDAANEDLEPVFQAHVTHLVSWMRKYVEKINASDDDTVARGREAAIKDFRKELGTFCDFLINSVKDKQQTEALRDFITRLEQTKSGDRATRMIQGVIDEKAVPEEFLTVTLLSLFDQWEPLVRLPDATNGRHINADGEWFASPEIVSMWARFFGVVAQQELPQAHSSRGSTNRVVCHTGGLAQVRHTFFPATGAAVRGHATYIRAGHGLALQYSVERVKTDNVTIDVVVVSSLVTAPLSRPTDPRRDTQLVVSIHKKGESGIDTTESERIKDFNKCALSTRSKLVPIGYVQEGNNTSLASNSVLGAMYNRATHDRMAGQFRMYITA